MSFARKLHDLRIENRLSLQDVADKIGVTKAHVFNLEKGKTANPSMELVVKLADVFRVRVSDLVGENPNDEDEPAEMVAMFRDFKRLSEDEREMIRAVMEAMKKKRQDKST